MFRGKDAYFREIPLAIGRVRCGIWVKCQMNEARKGGRLSLVRKSDPEFRRGRSSRDRLRTGGAPRHKFNRNLSFGIEYHADFEQIGHFLPLQRRPHNLIAVTDFKVGDFDIDFGVGHGFTSGSDRLIFKAILGYSFPLSKESSRLAHWLQKVF